MTAFEWLIQSCVTSVDEAPVTQHLTEEETTSSIIVYTALLLIMAHRDNYLNFLLTKTILSEQELLTVCRLQEHILKHKINVLNQITVDQKFNKL